MIADQTVIVSAKIVVIGKFASIVAGCQSDKTC